MDAQAWQGYVIDAHRQERRNGRPVSFLNEGIRARNDSVSRARARMCTYAGRCVHEAGVPLPPTYVALAVSVSVHWAASK